MEQPKHGSGHCAGIAEAPRLTFEVESWAEYSRDAAKLWERHWREVGLDHDRIPLGINAQTYQQIEANGCLHILTMRVDGQLVGYFLAFLMVNPHYKDAGLMAQTDVYWIAPEHRKGNGAKLLVEAERTLRARGVKKMYLSCKVQHDHSEFFEALGWRKTDYVFAKILG